jgi:hypothetical protein
VTGAKQWYGRDNMKRGVAQEHHSVFMKSSLPQVCMLTGAGFIRACLYEVTFRNLESNMVGTAHLSAHTDKLNQTEGISTYLHW